MKININQHFEEFDEAPAKAGKVYKVGEEGDKQSKGQVRRRREAIKTINKKCRHGKQGKYHNVEPYFYNW